MERREGKVLERAAMVVVAAAAVLYVTLLTGRAIPQSQPSTLGIFCGPSQVPAGESWVLVGSTEDLPADLVVSGTGGGVRIIEEQKLTAKAMAVRIQVGARVRGKLLRLFSASKGAEAVPNLTIGRAPGTRMTDASFRDGDFVKGQLVVGGDFFIYGYLPEKGVTLSAIRVHNRATGVWSCQDFTTTKEKEERVHIDDPAFVDVDPLETLPDTDGNGVPDFAEEPEVRPEVPHQMGIELAAGLNTLDLIGVDAEGAVSWRVINVFTTYTPEGRQ